MRFKVGDRVIDTVTGKRATVRFASPASGESNELYRLAMEDGRIAFRGGDELTPDEPPTTV